MESEESKTGKDDKKAIITIEIIVWIAVLFLLLISGFFVEGWLLMVYKSVKAIKFSLSINSLLYYFLIKLEAGKLITL